MFLRRTIIALLFGAMFVQPSQVLAAKSEETSQAAVMVSQSARVQDGVSLKIGVLYPKDGVVSAYGTSLQKAIDMISQQTGQNPLLPQVEFVSGELQNNHAQNNLAINKLVALGVDAIIAPNFLSALITVSPTTFDVIPIVSNARRTSDLTIVGADSLYSDLTKHKAIIRTIQRLKFRSRLEQVVLMYDPKDTFGSVGYQIATDILSQEHTSFSTEIFDAETADFFAMLEQIKLASPRATVIIIGQTADVADVIIQAHDEIGLTGSIVGLVGDGNPAIYDLADKEASQELSGVAWDMAMGSPMRRLVTAEFANDRFAAEAYVAIWSLLLGIDEEHPASRAGVRNAFIDHEGKNLENSSVNAAAWFYQMANSSVKAAVGNLSLPQISQLNGLATTNLQ